MKTYIRFGLIFSLVQTLFIAGEYLAGLHTDLIEYLGYGQFIFMIIAISIMVWGLNYRKEELGGKLAYTDSLLMGWVVGLVSGAIAVVIFQGYISYVNPEFFELAKQSAIDMQQMTTEEAEMQYAYPNYLVGMFIFSQVAGIITNAIAALFLKTSWRS